MAKPKPEEGELKPGIDSGSEENGSSISTGEGEASVAAGDTTITEENKSPEVKVNTGETGKAEPQELEDVRLVDWPPEREGIHTVHAKDGIFSFINGRATFKAEIASKLREAGYIE